MLDDATAANAMARWLYALDVEASPGGGLRATLVDGSGELGAVTIAANDASERQAIVQRLETHLASRDLTSLLACSGDTRPPPGALAALQGVALRARLDLWDFMHLVHPWQEQLSQRPCVVLTASAPELLPHHSLRSALRQAVREGLAPPRVLAQATALPMWSPRGPASLELAAGGVRLPLVAGPELRVLVGPPPGDSERALAAVVASGVPLATLVEEIDDSPQIVQSTVHDAVIRRLARSLDQRVRACGGLLVAPATGQDVLAALSRRDLGTLVVIAHHEPGADGLLLADGVLPRATLARHLAELVRRDPAPRRGAVDLCVCGADADLGLAALVQSLGVAVVLARRGYALLADCLAGWSELLADLEQFGPAPLPVLLDRVWLRRSDDTR